MTADKKADWSQPYPVHWLDEWPIDRLRATPGVYRVRAFKTGRPQTMRRLNGTDDEGILHIGKAGDLLQRLKSFRKGVIEKKFPAHFASSEFVKWQFNRLAKAEDLRFDFIVTPSEEEATERETELHRRYRWKFLDRPPLDSTSGERFKIGEWRPPD